MIRNINYLSAILILISSILFPEKNFSQKEEIRKVADKVIRETTLQFETHKQDNVLNLQVLNLSRNKVFDHELQYLVSSAACNEDAEISFGLSYNSPVKIWINNEIVFHSSEKKKLQFSEIAYNLYDFQDTINVKMKQGENRILIKTISEDYEDVILLRELTEKTEDPLRTVFNSYFPDLKDETWHILNINVENSAEVIWSKQFLPELELKNFYKINGEIYSWKTLSANLISEFSISDTNSYLRDSYAEWHYANGALMWTLINLSNYLEDNEYLNFVSAVCDLTINNYKELEYQYKNLFALRGANHRIYRRKMLDDTGAPCLPYLELLKLTGNKKFSSLVLEMIYYVSEIQVRLPDGTFCRPEPEKWTIWADDLFMSVPFLLRAGNLTKDSKYFDDAANQILNFNKYLFDNKTKLYKHGWFSRGKRTSIAFWSRANGWILWAVTEALLHLPRTHKNYDDILLIYQKHIEGLIKYQDQTGLWHQVLDYNDSFLETSSSAMFTLAISRGILNGWLDDKYKNFALKGWEGIKSKIMEDGTVIDICRGTGIGENLEFYFERKRFDHDPRGLGAVITAGIEVDKLIKRN